MPSIKLIVDSGSTKAEWCLIDGEQQRFFTTQGLSPYFLSSSQIEDILQKEIVPEITAGKIDKLFVHRTCLAIGNNFPAFK